MSSKLKLKMFAALLLMLIFFFFNCSSETPVVEEETEIIEEEPEDTHLDPNEGPIYSYLPKDSEKSLSQDVVVRDVLVHNKDIKDPLLMGFDNKENFVLYDDGNKYVAKFSKDASLGVIILDKEKLETSIGNYIAGYVKDDKIVLLQKLNNEIDAYILRYFDISGNKIAPTKIKFSNIKELIKSKEIEIDDKFSFVAEDVHLMENGNTAVTINETSSDNDHIEINRPQFLVFNPNTQLESVITIHPPVDTGFGKDYWKESTIEKFEIATAIYKDVAYILWGSGYSENSTLGYMYQKISLKSGGAGNNYTRVLKDGQDKENRSNDILPDKGTYVSRGIWVDKGSVYIRLKLSDGTSIIDMYNSRDDYRNRYILDDIQGLGNTKLTGPNNIVVMDNLVILASDKGIKLIDISTQ